MDNKVIELLYKMQKEQKDEFSKINSRLDEQFNIVAERFNKLDTEIVEIKTLLKGIANQFELTNENRIHDIETLAKRIKNVESDLYRLLKQ
jgi:predicted nuclease with TOPRIM domain